MRSVLIMLAVAFLSLVTLAGLSRPKPRRVPWRGRML